jgi:hypothetical protein
MCGARLWEMRGMDVLGDIFELHVYAQGLAGCLCELLSCCEHGSWDVRWVDGWRGRSYL